MLPMLVVVAFSGPSLACGAVLASAVGSKLCPKEVRVPARRMVRGVPVWLVRPLAFCTLQSGISGASSLRDSPKEHHFFVVIPVRSQSGITKVPKGTPLFCGNSS